MNPYYSDESVTLHHGDCLEVLRGLSNSSIDSVVCDPPYGLSNTDPAHVVETLTKWATGERDFVPTGRGFMGKPWDAFVPPPAVWDECMRVLKPGGHLLAFAGSRTFDLMTLSIRFAGFDIRDGIAWLYGSGFPKSLDVSKAIDKLDAAEERRSRALEFTAFIRESGLTAQRIDILTDTNMGGHYTTAASQPSVATADLFDLLRPHLPEVPERIEELVRQRTVESENYKAREVVGIDRRMNEPSGIVGVGQGERTEVERKITNAHTPAAQHWSGWGSAMKPAFEPIVVARKPFSGTLAANVLAYGTGALNIDATRVGMSASDRERLTDWHAKYGGKEYAESGTSSGKGLGAIKPPNPAGRWPANVVMDGDIADALDADTGILTSGKMQPTVPKGGNRNTYGQDAAAGYTTMETYGDSGGASRFFPVFRYQAKAPTRERPVVVAEDGTKTAHPTVKPLALMRWLVRLVTPPGGTVLEPFAGSGTTVEATVLEGMNCIAVEREADYLPLILARIERSKPTPTSPDNQLDIFGGAA